MKILGNILWLIFGGLECALGYLSGSVVLMITIVGIPFGIQTLKLGIFCLWPFGSTVCTSDDNSGCISIPMNVIWLIFGGLWVFLSHILLGTILCITIIGFPFGIQHFKMSKLALYPFGRRINIDL